MREYKTQMEAAKKGIITPEMQTVAAKEYMEPERLRELVAKGWVAIPANVRHTALSAEGVGSGLKTKINVNLGISGDCKDYTMEMQKVDMAIKSAQKPSWTCRTTARPILSANSLSNAPRR